MAPIRDYFAREGDPIFADRLASVLLARVIQTDTVAGGNERRRQISSELDFLVIVAVRRPIHNDQFTPLGSWRPPCSRMKLSYRRAASWSRPRSACE